MPGHRIDAARAYPSTRGASLVTECRENQPNKRCKTIRPTPGEWQPEVRQNICQSLLFSHANTMGETVSFYHDTDTDTTTKQFIRRPRPPFVVATTPVAAGKWKRPPRSRFVRSDWA